MSQIYYADALSVARRLYFQDRTGHAHYKSGEFKSPEWMSVRDALSFQLDQFMGGAIENNAALGVLKNHHLGLIPTIEGWLFQRGICRASCITVGTDALVLEVAAESNAQARTVLRIGATYSSANRASFDRLWCPLVLQPYQQAKLIDGETPLLSLELSPMLGVRLGSIPSHFINDMIFRDTPYQLKMNKDVGYMQNGASVYVDPDCVGYKSAEMIDCFADGHHDYHWQQNVMRTIVSNIERAGWPKNFWLAQTNAGLTTRQAALYPNPWPERPLRQDINLRGASF